jgi:hypothetical protein
MRKTQWIQQIVTVSVVAVTIWLFWPTMMPNNQVVAHKVLKPKASSSTNQIAPNQREEGIATSITSTEITANDTATLVAKAYAAELTFPPYSQPLTIHDFDRLQPNFYNPQSIPIDDNGTTVNAELSKYRYTYPEPIMATLSAEGFPNKNISNAELTLVDLSTKETLLTTQFTQGKDDWHATLEGERNLPNQLQATVKAQVNGKNISIAMSLKYIDSIATLKGFSLATNQGANMVLQASLITREEGLYRIRANLFDANKQPIAHLVSKEKLGKGSNHIDLKAHQSVLKGKQAPFSLSTFTIELMSPSPGIPTRYGDSSITQYHIDDFAVSSLNNEPYRPSDQETQRLQLLQSMAQGK